MPLASVDSTFSMLGPQAGVAIRHVQAKLIDSYILSNPQIVQISQLWDLYAGKQDSIIEKTLLKIGLSDLSSDYKKILRLRLEGFRARRGIPDLITPVVEREVFEKYKTHWSNELRCQLCGYHFREADLTSRRSALCSEFELSLASSIDPLREEDELKPISSENRNRYYLQCELDHRIPHSDLGPAISNNIQVLCRFCNQGKLGSNFSYDLLSTHATNAILKAYELSTVGHILTTVVSRLREGPSYCHFCGPEISHINKKELTTFHTKESWFVPWNLLIVCYDHWRQLQ